VLIEPYLQLSHQLEPCAFGQVPVPPDGTFECRAGSRSCMADVRCAVVRHRTKGPLQSKQAVTPSCQGCGHSPYKTCMSSNQHSSVAASISLARFPDAAQHTRLLHVHVQRWRVSCNGLHSIESPETAALAQTSRSRCLSSKLSRSPSKKIRRAIARQSQWIRVVCDVLPKRVL